MPNGCFLERVDDVKQLHTVARLLHISQHATAAINDAGFCHFAVINCIGGADILRPNDTGNGQFTHLEINPNLLAAPNDSIPVWQNLSNNRSDGKGNDLIALNRAVADCGFGRVNICDVGWADSLGQGRTERSLKTEQFTDVIVFIIGTGLLGFVVESCFVVD